MAGRRGPHKRARAGTIVVAGTADSCGAVRVETAGGPEPGDRRVSARNFVRVSESGTADATAAPDTPQAHQEDRPGHQQDQQGHVGQEQHAEGEAVGD